MVVKQKARKKMIKASNILDFSFIVNNEGTVIKSLIHNSTVESVTSMTERKYWQVMTKDILCNCSLVPTNANVYLIRFSACSLQGFLQDHELKCKLK